jgi:phage terminase large subunit
VSETKTTIQMHKKFRFLLEPHRYKIARGGRGGLKSWQFARALLILASESRLRILCTREVQKSIKDSVHKLLQDQIEELGLTHLYDVTENEITGVNGSLFIFQGLAQHTVKSIKSFEGIDICWLEEAETVSAFSWEILIPTIRKEGSEIWVSFNPELDTDDTYLRFVVNPPPNAVIIESDYRDNLWLTKELDDERKHDLATKPKDDYEHVWLGKCRTALPGAIFASEVIKMIEDNRLCHVPYDPRLKVHTVWDMGYNTDAMAVGLFQRARSELRVIGYLEERYKTVDWFVGELQLLRYNWGFDFLPWDGWVEGRQTGKSDAQLVKGFGRRVKPIPNVENAEDSRIKALRQIFRQIVMDKTKCARLVECLKRYRRNVPKHGEPSTPIHDQWSHGADMAAYAALVFDQMTNEDAGAVYIQGRPPQPSGTMGRLGAR